MQPNPPGVISPTSFRSTCARSLRGQREHHLELDAVLGGTKTRSPTSRLSSRRPSATEGRRHDAKLAGYDVPAESKILVNAWWLANNPTLWRKPEMSRPGQRILEEEAEVEPSGNDFRYLSLGADRWSCPGIVLALPIIGIVLGRLVQNFELLRPRGRDKIDTAEKAGQFSLHIMMHSTVVCKPRVWTDCICSRSGKSREDEKGRRV
nr:PREDICTED: LOW QUALITY PROTEIN: trans-cinnamate 4-monooxygenase [Musa acuminata subsp. malaccensis]